MPRSFARYAPLGIQLDAATSAQGDDVWSYARNMVPRNQMERIRGSLQVFGDPLYPPQHLLFSRDAADRPVMIYAGQAGVGLWDGTVHQDITPADFVAPIAGADSWSSGVLNSIPVLCNGGAWYWPGTGPLLRLPDWTATRRAYAMRPYKFHLIGMGINEGGTLLEDAVYWSGAAAPGEIPMTWTPAPDNEAGSSELSATRGQVIDGAVLRGSFVAYKNDSTYLIDYVGGSAVMAVRSLFVGTGILSRNCVAPIGAHHVVLTGDDVILHDGANLQSIADARIRRSLFGMLSNALAGQSFVYADEGEQDVWICVAEQGALAPNVAYVWNKVRDKWGVRDIRPAANHAARGDFLTPSSGETWADNPGSWQSNSKAWNDGESRYREALSVLGAETPASFWAIDEADDNGGLSVIGKLRKSQMDLGNAEEIKTVTGIQLEVEGNPTTVLRVSIGGSLVAQDSALTSQAAYVIGEDLRADVFATGRYFDVEIENVAASNAAPWRLVSMRLEFRARGRY
jgi:hypothetical protein